MTSGNKKILFLSRRAGFAGGIERWIYQTALVLRENGYEVSGCFEEDDRDVEKFRSAFDSIPAFPDALDQSFDLVMMHKTANNTRLRTLVEKCPEKTVLMVHDHDFYCPRRHKYTPFGRTNCFRPYAPLRCGLCASAVNPKFIGGFPALLRENFIDFPERFRIFQKIPRFAVLSRYMRDNLVLNGIAPSRITVTPPFVPMPAPLEETGNNPPVVLFAGQLIRGKGCDLFLQILARLEHDFRAKILGDGNDLPMLRRLAGELSLENKVEFLGWRTDPETVFRSADIALFPFRWQEPFGLVLAEAAAFGLPVAAFASGGAEESVLDGVSGYLTAPGDIEALAKRTDLLLENKTLRKTFGAAGRDLAAERFSKEKFLTSFQYFIEGGTKS